MPLPLSRKQEKPLASAEGFFVASPPTPSPILREGIING